MKSHAIPFLLVLCTVTLPGRAAQAEKVIPSAASDAAAALQGEADLVKAARQAALEDDDLALDATLAKSPPAKLKRAQSAAFAQRAAAVCGWLRNDNEHRRAEKLARRTIAQLAHIREAKAEDRVERLYWEAVLEAEILGRSGRAMELVREARQWAPEDGRLRELELRWANARGASSE